jgi:hypothetical protein
VIDARATLNGQLDIAWRLLEYHLADLTDDECLWQPAERGLHVRRKGGEWRADWPETEVYAGGPPTIAWITWHVGFWWSMATNHSFGERTLRREDVTWPGSTQATRAWLKSLRDQWSAHVAKLTDEEVASPSRTRWPFADRPFSDVMAWLNLELMKNAAELGYCRFLYGAREGLDGGRGRATSRSHEEAGETPEPDR